MARPDALPKTAPDADFIMAGDEVVILDGSGGVEAEGILVDADAETATVNVGGNWRERPFARVAHPDSPQAEAAAMFGDEGEVV